MTGIDSSISINLLRDRPCLRPSGIGTSRSATGKPIAGYSVTHVWLSGWRDERYVRRASPGGRTLKGDAS
jgi:hypothetical protein